MRAALGAVALLALASGPLAPSAARAGDLRGGARAYFVGPECRVRAEGPLDCDELTRVRGLRGEVSAAQLIVEATADTVKIVLGGAAIREQIFVPVTARSRGADPEAALPWSAAARPPDATALGRIADPLGPPMSLGTARSEASVSVAPGERRAWWVTVVHEAVLSAERQALRPISEPEGGPELEVLTIDRVMPPPTISVFAYLERDEPLLRPEGAEADGTWARGGARGGAEVVAEMLAAHQVLPVDRATSVEELRLQLRGLGEPRETGCDRCAERDLVVLGAYGTLGEPTDDAVARAVAMAREVPSSVRDVVLYAVDEECASDLPARWRRRLDVEGSDAALRIRVLATCGEDPRGVGADVVMMPAERFRPRDASAARAQGKEVWVYNGRLPQAGPMALDAPPESMIWLGWIAARYDVRRWFLWNVNHWSDRNRGGLGPRDPYADPETFHNADGDAVLYDGILVLPPRAPQGQPVASARLARLLRGIQDAALLGLAASIDPRAACDALELVVPRALGEVGDDEPTPFGDGRAIARARSLLLDVIERDAQREATDPARGPAAVEVDADLDAARRRATSGLVALRATLAAHAELAPGRSTSPAQRQGSFNQGRQLFAAAVVASCLVAAAIAAWRLARRRRARARDGARRPDSSPPVG